MPLAVTLTGGNRNDITQLLPLVDGITPVPGKVGRPRQRPDRIVADRGYDHDSYRRELRRCGVKTEHRSTRNRAWGLPYSRLRAYLPAIPQEVS